MAVCEKCWWDAYAKARDGNGEHHDAYVYLLRMRDPGCSPEDQCGDLHLVLDMLDGGRRCRCNLVVERAPAAPVTLPTGARTLRYVCVGARLDDPGAVLRPLLDAGWTTDGRVVLPGCGRPEIATTLVWRDEPPGGEVA